MIVFVIDVFVRILSLFIAIFHLAIEKLDVPKAELLYLAYVSFIVIIEKINETIATTKTTFL